MNEGSQELRCCALDSCSNGRETGAVKSRPGSFQWVWWVLVVGGVAWLCNGRPKSPLRETEVSIPSVEVKPPAPPAPPPPSSSHTLAEAKRVLLLVHTGEFRSRDVHTRALELLAQISSGTPESTEARQLERAIRSAYGKGPVPDEVTPARGTFSHHIAPTASAPSPLVRLPTPQGCAENGSCYGDISENTGKAKTTYVQGYYRKNGTYVRGHYRSR